MGIKGIGEFFVVGVVAAIVNVVYYVIGKCIRDLFIILDKL